MTREGTKAVNEAVVNAEDAEVKVNDAVQADTAELSGPEAQVDQGLADLSQLRAPSVFSEGREVVQDEALEDVLKFAAGAEVEGEGVTPERLVLSEMALGVVRSLRDKSIDWSRVSPEALLEENPFGLSLEAQEGVAEIRREAESFMRHYLESRGLSITDAVSVQGENVILPEAEKALGVIKRLREEAGELTGDPSLLLRKAA